MKKSLRRLKSASIKSRNIIKNEGLVVFIEKATKRVYRKINKLEAPKPARDILFIHEYHINFIERYRVDHPIEQMRFFDMSADKVGYDSLTLDMVKNYNGFVFYRCPITPTIQEFIKIAKSLNKTCYFSIDDLVIDTKYTDTVEVVALMDPEAKRNYDEGVNRMKATMMLCDYGITTTEKLQEEMGKYGLKEVFINRNVMSDEMIYHSQNALNNKTDNIDKVVIGYFSGSIAHNEDFALILPSLIKILKKYKNVHLKVAGILDVPDELKEFEDRLIRMEFKENWRELPVEIAECDFVLAPLVESIFNESKSEIKWLEAALVKVPIVSSNIGAFGAKIQDGVTGVLVENTKDAWVQALSGMVVNKEKRLTLAQNAYEHVMHTYKTSSKSGGELVDFMKSKLAPSVAFILPSTNISGGVIVALKHADILRKHGYNVSLVNIDHTPRLQLTDIDRSIEYNVCVDAYTDMDIHFDNMVATMWHTLDYIQKYPRKTKVSYFVQGYEIDFYPYGSELRLRANSTYKRSGVEYLTMSRWCQKWLRDDFGSESRYTPNGINVQNYPIKKRSFKGKIRILVEGDSAVDYKKVDESFKIINALSIDDIEVSYLSYNGKPKEWYRVDNFYNRIAPEEVGKIYAENDILIKSSTLESFSYPPLEMMATGGIAVIAPNDGNAEYARNDYNCLQYEPGNIESAVEKIEQVIKDKKLRDRIIEGGLETAKNFSWESVESQVLELYK